MSVRSTRLSLARALAAAAPRLTLSALLAAAAVAPARALMIGQPQSVTELGMLLRMDIPVRLDAGESLPRDCISVRTAAGEHGTGIGPLRIDTRPTRDGVMIEVQGTRALVEPILEVWLQLGCRYQRTQAYTLLVDPPRPELPMTQGGVVAAASAAQPAADAPATAVKIPARVASARDAAATSEKAGKTLGGRNAGRPSAPVVAAVEPQPSAARESATPMVERQV